MNFRIIVNIITFALQNHFEKMAPDSKDRTRCGKKYTYVDHSIDVQIFTPVPGLRKETMKSYTLSVFFKIPIFSWVG